MMQAESNPPKLHRRQRRKITELPTSIDGNQGLTRDNSASGLLIVQRCGKLKLCCGRLQVFSEADRLQPVGQPRCCQTH
jgi:hypothetical protein